MHQAQPKSEDRETYPLYALKYPPEVHSNKYEGARFCNAVRFQISNSAPLEAKYCRYTTFQRLHGVPYNMSFPVQDMLQCTIRGVIT